MNEKPDFNPIPKGSGLLHEYAVSRWLGLSRRSALWNLRPTRLRMIFALLHGNPVAYRLVIGKDGSALTFGPGVHGAVLAECHIYGDTFRRSVVSEVGVAQEERV